MVTLPLRPVLSRLWIPMIGLASIALLAALCVNYPRAYHKAMTAIMTAPYSRPFVDWEAVPAWIECWSKGVDVYIDNIPCLPLPNAGFNYSPLLLRLTLIRFAYGWTNLFGFSFAILFFLSLSLLPPSRTKLDFVITLLASVSSATAFAVERANMDLFLFLTIVVGVLACGSRLLVRSAGYTLIMLAGLLKFYPFVALILVVRERAAVFVTVAVAATTALGGLVLFYGQELVRAADNVPVPVGLQLTGPAVFGAKHLPSGLGFMVAALATKLFHQDEASAIAIGQLVYHSLLLLFVVQALAIAIWFGRRFRLPHAVAQLDQPNADFLLAGAALVCGCFFATSNVIYKAIFLLLALPGLLALGHQMPLQLARVAFRGACVAIVFVLWAPSVRECVRIAVATLGNRIDWSHVHQSLTDGNNQGMDRAILFVIWLCDQLAWWWIAIVLTAAIGALVLNSELWATLSRVLPLPRGGVYSKAPAEAPAPRAGKVETPTC
jgi:hypothetical protein